MNEQTTHIINIAGSRVSASTGTSASTSPPVMNVAMTPINQLQGQGNITVPLPPLTSNGSSGSSSGHSSMSGCTAVPPISSSSFDMVIEGTSNPHLRLIPSLSPSSQSSATSSPSAKVCSSQEDTYFPSTYSKMPYKDTGSSNPQHSFSSRQAKFEQNINNTVSKEKREILIRYFGLLLRFLHFGSKYDLFCRTISTLMYHQLKMIL